MNEEALSEIVRLLGKALEKIASSKTEKGEPIEDAKLRSIYAEYLVAHQLAKRGHIVQLRNERKIRSADIVVNGKKRVEVKSGKYREGWTDASFGKGSQIRDRKFDYCVFVTFSEEGSKVEEIFVFEWGELRELGKIKREGIPHFPETNPCVLLRCKNFGEYRQFMREVGSKRVKIEEELNEHPERYDTKQDNSIWDKIK